MALGREGMGMTTFWVDATGRLIGATSDPAATPVGAVDSTETAPDSAKHQTWNGTSWVDDPDRVDAEQAKVDLSALRGAGRDIAVVLTELIDYLLANTAMVADDFTPNVKQAYLDLKVIADRVK